MQRRFRRKLIKKQKDKMNRESAERISKAQEDKVFQVS
jgi:hypothetical protein